MGDPSACAGGCCCCWPEKQGRNCCNHSEAGDLPARVSNPCSMSSAPCACSSAAFCYDFPLLPQPQQSWRWTCYCLPFIINWPGQSGPQQNACLQEIVQDVDIALLFSLLLNPCSPSCALADALVCTFLVQNQSVHLAQASQTCMQAEYPDFTLTGNRRRGTENHASADRCCLDASESSIHLVYCFHWSWEHNRWQPFSRVRMISFGSVYLQHGEVTMGGLPCPANLN